MREQLPWATTPAARSFEALPPENAYPEMIQAYAAIWDEALPLSPSPASEIGGKAYTQS